MRPYADTEAKAAVTYESRVPPSMSHAFEIHIKINYVRFRIYEGLMDGWMDCERRRCVLHRGCLLSLLEIEN